jgi:RNA recognition motif-containing protein
VKERANTAIRIYVGDLSPAATDQDLFALFRPYGAVTECAVALDQRSGQCCGFGYVQMPDDRAALAAIAGLDGHHLDYRPMHVSVADPRGGPASG